MEQIIIDIDPDGSLRIDAVGFQGPDCEQATKFIEQVLGTVAQRRKKPEYHQRRQTRQKQRLKR